MPVVTFNGHMGAGGNEVGVVAARMMGADYVDRLVLAEAAKRIGSTVEALSIKEQRKIALRERVAYFFQIMLERSAMSGAAGEPYFSPGMEYLPSEEYTDLAQEPLTVAQKLKDEHVLDATSAVIRELANTGNVVIIGRASNLILKDAPGVLHVGVIAPLDFRISTIMDREHLNAREAGKYVTEMEKAREVYFRKFFKVLPHDVSLYHLVLNLGPMSVETAAEIVTHAAEKISSAAEVKTA